MTNFEWAMDNNAKFRVELREGQFVLACNVGPIGSFLRLEPDVDFFECIDYLCLCLKTGVEHDESREV